MRFICFILFTWLSLPGWGQTYYYRQIMQVGPDGQKSKGDNSGQFITFNTKGCYDSDREGYTVNNGFLKYIQKNNDILVYYGNSYWGTCYYYFNSSRDRLNVKTDKKVYVYERVVNVPAKIMTSSKIKSKDSSPVFVPPVITPPLEGVDKGDTPVRRTATRCRSCNGTGHCSVCKGKGWYKNINDGNVYDCFECHGSGRCGVCHGKGVID